MKNQPIQVDPNKDIDLDKKNKDMDSLVKHEEIKESSTTGQPEKQATSQTVVTNPFSNDPS